MPTLEFDWERFWGKPEDLDPPPSDDATREWSTVYHTMCDYVQPDSTLSLDDAMDRVLAAYLTANPRPEYSVDSIHHAYKCIGDEIPYDNPAQAKLVTLFMGMSEHPKYQAIFPQTSHSALKSSFFADLSVAVDCDPDQLQAEAEDPMFYVNACALWAKMMSRSLLVGPTTTHLFSYKLGHGLDDAVREYSRSQRVDDSTRTREAWIMGAAQYIRWKPELVFSFVRKYDKPLPPKVEKSALAKLKSIVYPLCYMEDPSEEDRRRERLLRIAADPEYKWDQWQAWQQMFKDVVHDHSYGETCRKLAGEAVNLMLLEEKKYAEYRHVEPSTEVDTEAKTLAEK